MRISNMGVVALFATAALYVGLWVPQAEAACKTASCMKPAVAASKSTAGTATKRPRHASAQTKLKTAYLKRGAKIADAASRGKRQINPTSSLKTKLTALPPSIANAHAELTTPDSRSADELDKNIAAVDENEVVTMNGVQIAAATQLNDMDRAVADQEFEQKIEVPTADIVVTQAESSAPTTGRIIRAVPSGEQHALTNADTETWSKTSLIGKIFVAFGSLLTLASAARLMFA